MVAGTVSDTPEDKAHEETMAALQARREALIAVRNRAQRTSTLNGFLVVVILITAAGAFFFVSQNLRDFGSMGAGSSIGIMVAWGPALFALYALVPLAQLPITRLNLRQAETDIQELDFQIDFQQFEVSKAESRAEKVLRLNDFQLRRYYDLNIRQNSWVFSLGIFCIALGIAIIATTVYLVISQEDFETQVIIAVLGAVGAILSDFIAIIYLRMNTAVTENLAAFHSRLVETHQLLLGNLLASRIEDDEKRWETLSQLSLQLMKKG